MKKKLAAFLSVIVILSGVSIVSGSDSAFAAPTEQTASKGGKKNTSSKKKKKTTSAPSANKKKSTSAGKTNGKQSARKGKQTKPRTAAEIKKAREQNTAALRETRRKLNLNTKETEQRLNQLNLLEGEIANCNVNIGTLSHNIDSINRAIGSATDSIQALDTRLKAITDRYVRAVRKTQSARQQKGALAFIFSSESFSQAYRRMRSLKQFSKWRKRRSSEITTLRSDIDKRKTALSGLRESASATLGRLNGQKALLVKKQGETSTLVDRLKSEGAELNAIMDRRQREARALDAELDRIIAEEAARQERIRREKEAAERKAAAEARRKAEAEAAAKAEAEREAAEKAEAERLAAVEAEKARAAAREAQKAKEAEKAAQARAAEAERKAAAEADKEQRKLAEKKAKQERAAAKKAEQERVKAEREAAKRQAEADKQGAQAKARAGKPVKHKGKNNMGGAALPASSSSTTEAAATRLAAPVATGASGIAATAVEADLGSDFEKARGRLPYPVSGRYTIVKGFGRQKHPTLPHVETNNSGIDMQTEPGATVRSVFDGEVSAVFRPDGYNTVVVIRHGRYMTVYANLGAISVSNGQKVKAGQAIGTVFTDTADANRSVLHFEIRNQRVKENPTAWLR